MTTEATRAPPASRLGCVAGGTVRGDIIVEDIFDPSNSAERAAPYRLANKLHLNTRDDAVRSQLLFSESEPYSQQKIEETERLLRGRRYLFDAHISASCYHGDEQTVDMDVRVRDVWSLNPGFSFSRCAFSVPRRLQCVRRLVRRVGDLFVAAVC